MRLILLLAIGIWFCSNYAFFFASAVEFRVVSYDLFTTEQSTEHGNLDVTLRTMNSYVMQASMEGIHVVTFPEGLLWWFLPSKEAALVYAPDFIFVRNGTTLMGESLNPCLDPSDSSLLSSVSCMSRLHNITMVTNMATRSCPTDEDKCRLYNTAIVTGIGGELIATYRKYHIYGSSPPFDAPATQDLSFFMVEQVTIGLLVCFDIEFQDPLETLLRDFPSIQVLVVPMAWVNTPPISWSILYLQALSYMHPGLTIVGAGSGSSSSTWGAGIYEGGVLVSDHEAWSIPYDGIIRASITSNTQVSTNKGPPLLHVKSLPAEQKIDSDSFNCTIPFYGISRCARMFDGSARVSNGRTSCTAEFINKFDGESLRDIMLVSIDVVFASQETTVPLHILACAVLQCISPQNSTSSENSAISCAASTVGEVSFASDTISLQLEHLGNNFLVFPLVGTSTGNTLDASHWTYADENKSGGTIARLIVEGECGGATLLGIQQSV